MANESRAPSRMSGGRLRARLAPYAALCLAVPLVLSGCGEAASGKPAPAAGGEKRLLTDFAGREIALNGAPQRIVTLSIGDTDIVYALGGEVVGRPDSSAPLSYEAAERAPAIGTAHEVDLERIALLRPDVVLGNEPMNEKDIPTLEGLGAKVVLTSANSIAEIERQIRLIGQLLGREERAEELVGGIEAKLAALSSSAAAERPRTLLVYGAPGTFMAALPSSLGGDILRAAGGDNIAADYPRLQSYPQYAQLNAERIVESDPEAIFIMTHGNPDAVGESFRAEMRDNSAWNNVAAVRVGRVEVLPAELFGSSPGTRVVEALELMRGRLAAISGGQPDDGQGRRRNRHE